jgi:hypothetical protein
MPNEKNRDTGIVLSPYESEVFFEIIQSRLSNGITVQLSCLQSAKAIHDVQGPGFLRS